MNSDTVALQIRTLRLVKKGPIAYLGINDTGQRITGRNAKVSAET